MNYISLPRFFSTALVSRSCLHEDIKEALSRNEIMYDVFLVVKSSRKLPMR